MLEEKTQDTSRQERLTMTEESKRIRLSWDDFPATVSQTFGSIRDEEYLADVTLMADDNSKVTAHRLVLSASSEYFKSIFKSKPSLPNLVLCLEMVDKENLNQLLDYMYCGEVRMEEVKLENFLKIAKRFKLEGLCEEDTSKTIRENVGEFCEVTLGKNDSLSTPPAEENSEEEKEEESQDTTNVSVKQETRLETSRNIKGEDEKELDEMINQFIERRLDDKSRCQTKSGSRGQYVCKLCGKTSNLSRNLKNHIETHMEGLEFQCKLCEKKCKTRAMLAMHVSKYHKKIKEEDEASKTVPETDI